VAQSFLVFDFQQNESAAQQARHKIEAWKQAFRLDRKVLLKFDRQEAAGAGSAKGAKSEKDDASIYLLVRLDFSDHERLSHQRWLDRIPSEEPFKQANPQVIREADAGFDSTAERFDNLT
jgi:hypothetical protein